MRECVFLDRVHQGARFAVRGNQIEPTPGREMTLLAGDPGDIRRDRIQPAKIVEQPAVDLLSPQCILDTAHEGGPFAGAARGRAFGV